MMGDLASRAASRVATTVEEEVTFYTGLLASRRGSRDIKFGIPHEDGT